MKTIVRTLYILAAAAIVFAGLFAYAMISESSAPVDQPIAGELRGSGQGLGQGTGSGAQRDPNKAAAGKSGELAAQGENIEMGHSGEHFSGDPGVLILIRNVAWVTGTIVIVLLLQAGWKRWSKRKPKASAGSA